MLTDQRISNHVENNLKQCFIHFHLNFNRTSVLFPFLLSPRIIFQSTLTFKINDSFEDVLTKVDLEVKYPESVTNGKFIVKVTNFNALILKDYSCVNVFLLFIFLHILIDYTLRNNCIKYYINNHFHFNSISLLRSPRQTARVSKSSNKIFFLKLGCWPGIA